MSSNNFNNPQSGAISKLQKKNPSQPKHSPQPQSSLSSDQTLAEQQTSPASFFQLFRFADKTDKILMAVGTIGALVIGAAFPLFALLWGNMTNTFGQPNANIVDASKGIMLQFIYIGIGTFVFGWIMYGMWMVAGERQSIRCRQQYLKSLLAQEIGWFDRINQAQLSSRFTADCFAFQGAIGEKVSLLFQTSSMFISGFVVAFTQGWQMSLVTLGAIPVLFLAGGLYGFSIQTKQKQSSQSYARAGGMAEQCISSIKTVKQLNGQQFQIRQYQDCLLEAASKSMKFALLAALALGLMSFSMFAAHALAFWYGSHCVQNSQVCSGDPYKPGQVIIVFFSLLMAALNLSQLTPAIKKIAQGKSAAARIFAIIDREPLIRNPQNGKIPDRFQGKIQLKNISFSYPKNPNQPILNKLSLTFDSNKTSSLVGESGCGKSTVMQLLMRFYDPTEGAILLDGIDLRELDLGWLRSQLGYVGQQPVLFAMSIKENLLLGKQNATDKQIQHALEQSQAWEFVQQLENGIDTYVGAGGGQLSGGQKQRIAIARALLRNPQILLLDQATSALDRKNQKLIQRTLDKIGNSRTTISIAHRTRTVMNSDMIFVMDKGGLVQKGKFQQLDRFKGNKFEEDDEGQDPEAKQQQNNQVSHWGGSAVGGVLSMFNNKKNDKKQSHVSSKKVQNETKPAVIPNINSDTNLISSTSPDLVPAATKEQLQKQVKEQQKQRLMQTYKGGIYSRLFQYSEGSRCLMFLGLFFCMCSGLAYPTFVIFFAKMLMTLFMFQQDAETARRDANQYALIFTIIAVAGLISAFINSTLLSIVGEKITRKVRLQAYSKIVKMPIHWFDLPVNDGGILTSKLASDSLMVNGLTATFLAILVQNMSTLVAGVVIALVFEWRTALFALALLPLIIIVGLISQSRKAGFSDKTDAVYKQSNNIILQSMTHIRTVSSFGYEDVIFNKYSQHLQGPLYQGVKKGVISGLLFGLSQLILFSVMGLIFFMGSVFKRDNNLQIDEVFTAIYGIFFSAITVGNNSHFLPDIAQGKLAAARLFSIIDSEDEDQLQICDESKLLKTPIKGDISISHLSFKYESRNIQVFNDFSLHIKQGNKVGFVGASGCGKSTIMQLIQRFYEPSSGSIKIDGIDIKDFDIHHLRKSLGVVSQEPTLFNGSFRYNMQYNEKEMSEQVLQKAAKSANALSFIKGEEEIVEAVVTDEKRQTKQQAQDNTNVKAKQAPAKSQKNPKSSKSAKNPNGSDTIPPTATTGFDRSVGIKGSHISGGQKQRIAIARTILRDPKILLLDQATSALDSNNEKIVQQALDKIMQQKTTVSIAHRIETIKNSDQINVFEKGKIVESGNYADLVALKGYFYNLQRGTQFL